MGRLDERLRRLEELFVRQPTADEYLDAENREHARARKAIAEKLQPLPGFPVQRVFAEWDRRILVDDTSEQRERDRQTIEARRKAHGIDPEMEAESANEKLEAMLQPRAWEQWALGGERYRNIEIRVENDDAYD